MKDLPIEEIRSLYLAGHSISSLVKIYKCNKKTISRRIKDIIRVQKPAEKILFNCQNCNNETEGSLRDYNRNKNHFCSRRCSAVYFNNNPTDKILKGRRKCKEKYCKYCNDVIVAKYQKVCDSCKELNRISSNDMSIKDAIYENHHKSSAYALIRSRARSIAKTLGWNKCCKCGYDKHIEISHIKSIPSFSEDTMISVVNDKDNLMPLCPNCHWEYDYAQQKDKSNTCEDCGKSCSISSIRCKSCAAFYRAKVKKPTKEQLQADFLELKTFIKMGQKYNVSKQTVRNWFKFYDIKL